MKKFLFLLLAMIVTSLMIYADVPTSSNRPGGNKSKTTNSTGKKPSTNSSGKNTPNKAGNQKKNNGNSVSKNKQSVDKSAQVNTFTDGISLEMIEVEGGTFQMGATEEQIGAYDDEKPVHQVTLSTFMIGKTEVTQELWEAVMGSNPSYTKGANLPVEQVSWDDCQEFIAKLNNMTGYNFRLPTEAEWEYAARGGNKSKGYLYSGSDNLDAVAWYVGNSGWDTHPVATKVPNELGIYDMCGNVEEWCCDWYGSYSKDPVSNPKGVSSGFSRVYRGGGWGSDAVDCRVARRYGNSPVYLGSNLGLRLAL